MKFIVLSIHLLVSAFAAPSQTTKLLGKAYEKGSQHTKLLFTFKKTQSGTPSDFRIESQFTAPDGSPLVSEEAVFAGGKLKNYLVHHKQTQQEGSLEIGEKMGFRYTKNGETSEDSEDVPQDLVIGPIIINSIQARWDSLMKGESESFRYAVLDRKETVGFKFFKEDEEVRTGRAVVHFIMKPTSFVIAALVDPVHFYYWKDTHDIAEIRGRTLPKQLVDGKFKDLDAEILYEIQKN